MSHVSSFAYESPLGGQVPSWLVTPHRAGSGPAGPGILFLHPASGDKDTFLDDARRLADERRATSLLIDAPFRRPGGRRGGFADPETEARNLAQTIADLRRGVDVLSDLPGVSSLHYVGRNFGAALGGVLAGSETRIASYVLIAGLPAMSDFWAQSSFPLAREARARAKPGQIEELKRLTSPFDGAGHIGRARARILFQFGRQDDWIPEPIARRYIKAAPEAQVRWYDDDHEMQSPAVREDWHQFLG